MFHTCVIGKSITFAAFFTDMMQNNDQQPLYGLLGYPLEHSFSKAFFTEKFIKQGIDARYENFSEAVLDGAAIYRMLLLNPTLSGFNVTAPYKEAIMDFRDNVYGDAVRVGAVNTVCVRRTADGRFIGLDGYNTDVEGFRCAFDRYADRWASGSRGALVLGSGGASKAVRVALDDLGFTTLRVSRRPSGEDSIAYGDIDRNLLEEYPVIVNATPVGMYPDTDALPDIPYSLLGSDNLCFDLIYNPERTRFMECAARYGAEVCNGAEMLRRQALASWKIWNTPE